MRDDATIVACCKCKDFAFDLECAASSRGTGAGSTRWRGRLGSLDRGERLALFAMGATVVVLFFAGFALLFGAAAQHFRVSRTATFGVGTGVLALTLGCAMPSTPTTSRPSTTPPGS